MMAVEDQSSELVGRGHPMRWLAVAAIGAVACAAIYVRKQEMLLEAYWIGWVTWTGVSVGALGILAIYGLMGGHWGRLLGPALAAASRPLWLMAALALPVIFLVPAIFPWGSAGHAPEAQESNVREWYLSGAGFQVRAAIYGALWLLLAAFLPGRRLDEEGYVRPSGRLSALALPLIVLSVTFSSIDWMMSLEGHWHSTGYGVIVLGGQAASAFALAIIVAAHRGVAVVSLREPTGTHGDPQAWIDVGNLLLAAVCFWMYVTFAQFLVIWSGNLPEEASWYVRRSGSVWSAVAVALVVLHWAVPFILLLSRDVKRRPRALAFVAGLVLVMHMVDVWWLMAPSLGHSTIAEFGCDWLAIATIGAAWMFVFNLGLPRRAAE